MLFSLALEFIKGASTAPLAMLFESAAFLLYLFKQRPASHLLGLHPTSAVPVRVVGRPAVGAALPCVRHAQFKPFLALTRLPKPLDLYSMAHARSLAKFLLRHRSCGLYAAPTMSDHHCARARYSLRARLYETYQIAPYS